MEENSKWQVNDAFDAAGDVQIKMTGRKGKGVALYATCTRLVVLKVDVCTASRLDFPFVIISVGPFVRVLVGTNPYKTKYFAVRSLRFENKSAVL